MSLMGLESGYHFNSEKYTTVTFLIHNTLLLHELTNWLIFLSHMSLCKRNEMTMLYSPDLIKSSHIATVVFLSSHI